ncbi:MAG TPA: class I SAM-dependent methyltransferase [Gemmataceae bacterium]|nr:class I SAM-dependent methyltransferase [Gemmataceae bacterium]
MSDLSRANPTGRFSGLADSYAKYRPDYPPAAIAFVLSRCGLGPGSVLVDVGCGTGISSRLFAARGLAVLGVEPNDEMRRQAEAVPSARQPAPLYCKGRAEETGLPDAAADAVLAAQAFHWFDAGAALREFHRILKPGGWVALLWNERDESDPFTAAYGEVIRSAPEAKAVELPRGRAGEPLLASPLFEAGERVCFPNSQALDEEGMLGRAFSASYAPKEPAAAAGFADALRAVFGRFQQQGQVVLRYATSVYVARRAAVPA